MRIYLEITVHGENNDSRTEGRIREIIERELSREFGTPVDVEYSENPYDARSRGYDQGRSETYFDMIEPFNK